MRRLSNRLDLDDERVLIGVTAGLLWLVGSLAAAVAQLLPGAPGIHGWLFVAFVLVVFAYGVTSVSGAVPWHKVSVERHALASAALMPLLGLALWMTGGARSYVQPLLIFVLAHLAYFFRPRLSIPLVFELVLVFASPLAYEAQRTTGAYPARVLAFAVTAAMLTTVIRLLKERLVRAEARQRRMALADPLTGLVNRRGFDAALRAATARAGDMDLGRRSTDGAPGFALILLDLDGFKHVNDTKGHPAGDHLLRLVASHCAAAVRPGDTLARIGGDEFAVVAPGAGGTGAQRLADALREAIEEAGARTTVAWAVHPDDGETGEALLRAADRRLYTGKADRPYDLRAWSNVSASSPSA
jgi:diguanylate cyclase (GGDEF)-like protein